MIGCHSLKMIIRFRGTKVHKINVYQELLLYYLALGYMLFNIFCYKMEFLYTITTSCLNSNRQHLRFFYRLQPMTFPALHLHKVSFVAREYISFYGQLRFPAEKEETLLYGRVGVFFRSFPYSQGSDGYLCQVRICFYLLE